MRISSRPIEGKRIDRFRPPHCPWPECPDHRPRRRYRCTRQGSFRRQCEPKRRVPRFKCPTCGRGFSLQSFACTYYLKRPELLLPVAAALVAGSAHGQIARSLDCAPRTALAAAAGLGAGTPSRYSGTDCIRSLRDLRLLTRRSTGDRHSGWAEKLVLVRAGSGSPPRRWEAGLEEACVAKASAAESDRAVARERDRQMFPVDLLHKLWRHTQAHHRRETIAFGRRSNAVMERGFLYIVWRNFVKRISERTRAPITPAVGRNLAHTLVQAF